MAGNKKIFDLPLRTGVTADDRLAIVDSGNTTTYSVKLSDLQDGTGVNTLESLTGNITLSGGTDITITDNGSDTITISSSATNVSSLESLTGNITFSGTNIDITTSGQTIYLSGSSGGGGGGVYQSGTGTSSIKPVAGTNTASGDFSAVLNGDGNTQSGNYGIVSGLNNTASGPQSFIIGGTNNTANNGLGNGGIIGGNNNTSGERSGIVFGRQNNVGSDGFTFGAHNSTISTNNNPNRDAVILGGAYNIEFTNGGSRNTFLGGYANKIYNAFTNAHSNIWGGEYNWIDASGTYASPSYTNWSGDTATIINSKNSNIKNGQVNTILNSESCVTTATTRTTIISCSGFTATADDMVYVPALNVVNYASLNFSGDTAAATGGVELGGLYHDNGAVRVRIT